MVIKLDDSSLGLNIDIIAYQLIKLTEESYQSIHPDIQELLKLLVSIVKTSKGNIHAK